MQPLGPWDSVDWIALKQIGKELISSPLPFQAGQTICPHKRRHYRLLGQGASGRGAFGGQGGLPDSFTTTSYTATVENNFALRAPRV